MKMRTTWLGAVLVLAFAACSVGPMPAGLDISNTVLTGQVLQRDASTVTLNLGELAIRQTSESALPTVTASMTRSSSHTAPNGQTSETALQDFVSWQQDAVLDLSDATFYMMTDDGKVEPARVEDIEPQDILNVSIGGDSEASAVLILTQTGSKVDSQVLQGNAANTLKENMTIHGKEYTSESEDENALCVQSAQVDLRNVRVEKADGGSSNAYRSERYGLNAALLATGGARLSLTNGIVNSSAAEGAGIVGHGVGTDIQLSNGTVTTTGDGAGGLQTSAGARIQAKNMTVITAGDSAPVVQSGPVGSRIETEGGTYTSGGYNSPAVYAAGNFQGHNSELTANNSAAIVLEGAASVSLENCTVNSNQEENTEQTSPYSVLIHGDQKLPEQGTAVMDVSNGSIVSRNGYLFHVAGTTCEINLDKVQLTDLDENDILLQVGSGEGSEGKPSSASLNASKQTLTGKLLVYSDSTLHLNLENHSDFLGAVYRLGNAGDGNIDVHIGKDSTWSLTGDSVVDTLQNEGTIYYNGYSITLGDGTVLTA